jgi:hypothetical protein
LGSDCLERFLLFFSGKLVAFSSYDTLFKFRE